MEKRKDTYSQAGLAALMMPVLSSASLCAAASEPFLKVDVNASSQVGGGATQSGWNDFNYPGGDVYDVRSRTYEVQSRFAPGGSLTVEIGCGSTSIDDSSQKATARDREVPKADTTGFPLSDVYRDFVTGSPNIFVRISGLATGTAYDLHAYCYDNSSGKTNVIFRMLDSDACGVPGRVRTSAGMEFSPNTDVDVCAATVTAYPAADGTLTFRVSEQANKGACLCGFTLAKAAGKATDFSVDFGNNTLATLNDGFAWFVFSGENRNPHSQEFRGIPFAGANGQLTVTISMDENPSSSNKFIYRDRNGNASGDVHMYDYANVFPLYQACRDIIIAQNEPLNVKVEGLLPSAKFFVSLCPYDWAGGKNYTMTDMTSGTAGASDSVTIPSYLALSSATKDEDITVGLELESDESGVMALRVAPRTGSGVISWLRLKYLPEKSGMVLFFK